MAPTLFTTYLSTYARMSARLCWVVNGDEMVDKYCSKESKEIKYQENRVKEPPLEDGMQSICKKRNWRVWWDTTVKEFHKYSFNVQLLEDGKQLTKVQR